MTKFHMQKKDQECIICFSFPFRVTIPRWDRGDKLHMFFFKQKMGGGCSGPLPLASCFELFRRFFSPERLLEPFDDLYL